MISTLMESVEQEPLLSSRVLNATEVYPIIHQIKYDVMRFIDTPLTFEALTSPDLTYTLVLPLEEKYGTIQRSGNKSVVFCFLLNRVRFQRDQHLGTQTISRSRAALCEILATRLLRHYGNSTLDLTLALTTSWPVYSGCDERVLQQAREERDDLEDRVGNGIELAIVSKAKRFIKSSSFQKVINGIWSGKCVYQAESNHSILSDTYKRTPVHFYDPHKAPLLDHYRLKVPAIRSVLEYFNFLTLFILFVLAIELNALETINLAEAAFMVFALGFSLEKVAAMQEHGIKVYSKGTWNGFDLAFVTTYFIYASLRLYGVFHPNVWARDMGIDCLALIACLLFPRLAFVTLKDNLMVLSLRAMMMQFVILMLIAFWCFGGFLYALWTLSRTNAGYSAGTIAWWMLDLWFGLDASGFDKATQFHPIFGPVLVVTYACLSNTLLLTVLVSILSHTFSTINEDAAAEAMFRKAVSTIEGVKADSLFSYQPPVNLIALFIMLPASYILTPRWFHKVNVFMIRITSFPILLAIAWYERHRKSTGSSGFYETVSIAAERIFDTLPRSFKRITFFEGLAGSDADIDAIFQLEEEVDESALDTDDYPGMPTDSSHHQLASHYGRSPRRPSSTNQKRPNLSHSPQRREQQHQAPPPSPHGARAHLSSMLNRGAEAAHAITSPLAQVFQPLVVDDDPAVADPESGPFPTAPVTTGVSYGPATRRRLSSMKRTPTNDPFGGQASPFRKISATGNGPRAGLSANTPLSDSPKSGLQIPDDHESRVSPLPQTAGETEELEINSGGIIGWTRRLGSMEERQKRIEDLLMQLVTSDGRK